MSDVTNCSPSETTTRQPLSTGAGLLCALLLGFAGFAGNWFKFPLFFNVDYIFGSFFAMLAVQLLGWRLGTLSGLMAASCSWLLWNHPYAIIIFTAETLVTALIFQRRKGDLLLANTLYWLFIGMPLVLLFYSGIMQIGDGAMAIMFKQAINGMANTIMARLVVISLQSNVRIRPLLASPGSLREILSTLLAFFAIFSSLVLLAAYSRQQARETEMMIIMLLKGAGMQATSFYQQQLPRQSPAEVRENLRALVRSTRNNLRLHYTLLDRHGTALEYSRPDSPLQLPIRAGDPRIQLLSDGIQRWVSDARPNISISERWKRSAYLLELSLGEWRLILTAPTGPWLPPLHTASARALFMTLAVVLVTVLVGGWVSNRITRSLSQLGNATERLPQELAGGKHTDLPVSSIPDVCRLIDSFHAMTSELAARFHALQKARTLLAEIENSERSRVSRELHDGIAQSLQGVRLNLQMLNSQALEGTPCNQFILEELVQEMGRASDELRDVILALRPTLVETMGLPEALRWLAETVARRHGIAIHFSHDCEDYAIEGYLALNLFRICQEAVSNSIRHSRADSISIVLSCQAGCGRLMVCDNGLGGAAPSDQGFGLKIMQERVELCNGRFTLDSRPGKGTEISVEVPLS